MGSLKKMDSVERDLKNDSPILYVNGIRRVLPHDLAHFTLLEYLRDIGLTGTKLGCGEGGCGACTVMVSHYDTNLRKTLHYAINACLAPLYSVEGMHVITVEGLGSCRLGLHPIQESLARTHGSQCGFCTPGFVMSMYALLRSSQTPPSEEQIEECLAGNLCRCTGYRAILDAFRVFAKTNNMLYTGVSSTGLQEGQSVCPSTGKPCSCNLDSVNDKCVESVDRHKPTSYNEVDGTKYTEKELIFPPELLLRKPTFLNLTGFGGLMWYRPLTLQHVLDLKAKYPDAKLLVGNTEVGIEMRLKRMQYQVLVSVMHVPELNILEVTDDGIEIGAAMRLSILLNFFRKVVTERAAHETSSCKAFIEQLKWFAGSQIRNVSSIGGNICTASPISDLNPLWMATRAKFRIIDSKGNIKTVSAENFFLGYRKVDLASDEILLSVFLPWNRTFEFVKEFKQSHRRDDDIAIVNAGIRVHLKEHSENWVVADASIVYGGVAPCSLSAIKTKEFLIGKIWDQDMLQNALKILQKDIVLKEDAPGGMVEFRKSLTLSFFFKFFLWVSHQMDGIKESIPTSHLSAVHSVHRPPATGSQDYEIMKHGTSVGSPEVHQSSRLQVTGEALYADDTPMPPNGLHAALVLSRKPHARILSIDDSVARSSPGFVGLFLAKDIPGDNMIGAVVADEELFAVEYITCVGQVIGVAVADTHENAKTAARKVHVEYEELPAILSIQDAINARSFHPNTEKHMRKGDVDHCFQSGKCDRIIEGEVQIGGQEHFYLEPHGSLVWTVDGGNEVHMISSTQAPQKHQKYISHVLGLPMSKVVCKTKRIGGGFGGKETRSAFIAAAVSVPSYLLNRPVKIILDRDVDMMITGQRHSFLGKYKVGFTNEGKVLALDLEIYNNAGNSLDLSLAILERAMFHSDNVYEIPNVRITGRVCFTNFPSNTAFRGFGGPQGMLITENWIQRIAVELDMSPEVIKEINFQGEGSILHYGQILEHCPLSQLWNELKLSCDFVKTREEVDKFNAHNRWRKRNKGKMQHSLWVAEISNSNFDEAASGLLNEDPMGVLPKHLSFRRIWQGKGAQTAACKVFMATDDDAAPAVCFFHQEQRKLLSVSLQTVEINNEIVFDVKPDKSWIIAAVAASPVMVTRPRVKIGLLPYSDIMVLTPENALLLYSGKQCLCQYVLPSCLNKDKILHDLELPESSSLSNALKITGLADAVEGRVNVIVNNKQMFRCALRQSPSSSLANDCITALAEGLGFSFYRYFLGLLWKDDYPTDFSVAESSVDSEWDSFGRVIMKICRKSNIISEKHSGLVPHGAWKFLLSSQFHTNFCKANSLFGKSCAVPLDQLESNSSTSSIDGKHSFEEPFYTELLVECLESLHALYESLKLDNLRKRDLEHLAALLCNIANFLGEDNYLDHYIRDFPILCKKFLKSGTTISPKIPPSLFRWLENCLQHGFTYANISDLPSLVRKDGYHVVSLARKIVCFYSILSGANLVGKKLSSGVYCNITTGSHSSKEELTVLAMVGERFGLQQLDSLPSGVSLPLRHALDKCRDSSPNDWPAAAYVLLGRQDLAMSTLARECKYKEIETPTNVNVISMSTPYMLNLHPVTISSTISDAIGLEGTKLEDTDSVDGSMLDGMEHIFNSSTQLRYGRDLRLNEVRRLLCSSRPVAIQTSVNHSASDQDLQQTQLWNLAQRTTSLPLGRGAFTLATIHTLLTETFSVPKLVLAGRLPAQQNATVNLDPNIRNIQELKSWPEFHNAVAAGLRLAPLQGKMSRTWIAYNKPEEPSSVHAGLLLALGLHGFLRVLSVTDIYQYISQEHESTSVGLMLGLASSYRGTMQPAVSKLLYVHIPVRHPSSYPELEVPTLLQSAALMSLGILYESSAHPQTMQVLLGEIGRRSGGDNVLEREGHAVSAGFALGLVALGRGEDALGFIDSFVNRLFLYIGGKVHNERSHFSTISMDENRGSSQMMDGTTINIDVTAPGATIALALMFLKTEAEAVASRLSIPNTRFDLQYVRPDFIMLRVIARNLIMWSSVHPSKDWVWSQIPEIVRCGVEGLGGDDNDIDDMDGDAFKQAYVNIVAGACISLGLVFAGTRNGNAQELLYEFAMYFLNEIKPVSPTSGKFFPKGLSRYIDRGTLETCLHLIVLSLSVVMAGSGHLQTFRLLRFLRSRNCADGQSSYGIQMAVSLATGFLFLGGGMRTFSTNSSSIAALLITLYPRLPMGPNDNRCHLQAFRHLYVLATEARWIQTVDVDTGLPVYAPIEVTVRETEHYAESSFCEVTPCLLPERAILKTIRVCGPRYWPQVIDFIPEDKPWWNFGDKNNPFNSGILFIKRKVGACSYVDDPIGCQSLLSRAMHKVFGLTSLKASDTITDVHSGSGSITVDQLVSTFSSDPSLIAFAQFCCDPAWYNRSDVDFKEFCLQVLFECVSKDRPALLQVYLSLYTTVESMVNQITTGADVSGDSLSISGFKLALTYIEALMTGKLSTPKEGIVQSTFVGSLRKQVEELLNSSQELKDDFHKYLKLGKWPDGESQDKRSILLSWFLQWYNVPASSVIRTAIDRVKPKRMSSSSIPLLRLSLPRTHINVISEIDRCFT